MSDLKKEAQEALERAKGKIAPIVEDVKEKSAPVIADIREKTDGAIDAVKEGAEKLGSLFAPKGSAPNVKNELFDELEAQAVSAKEATRAKAEEMQRRLEEMMGGKKEE